MIQETLMQETQCLLEYICLVKIYVI